MDAIGFFNIVLRLTIWFLLTADLSPANIIIGVSIAFLLPRSRKSLGALKDWLDVLWEIVVAIPQAYIEAIQIMLRPHNDEVLVCEKVKPKRTPGLIFLDIFLITFTPKSIVLKYHEQGWYEVHVVRRMKNK
ncbi:MULTISPECIES: Na+/H+ antiporter subunit E [Okeania]|uniref:Cation:proton antiporter n=1 Tax=Okeania hirsuta TaxID=1458930 RepID=A0A3N6PVZ1_9CYAN|nr:MULTISPECIES: Na+/H+ antiporter subunit E [Okeania]NES76508.1 cation:proton antiporter [Okeania sp. SIO1H4]NES88332.1 cation:proton antiporter [Okeania sp. SIO2B9]NET20374.1 cation:proton antiporter [Okeania sp. SIO1H5]NET77034.1 cation:proton antiporter [Okeania sp. SIO1F9]NET94640.1 cation:proton antiporter [Okeania sp. SIO1H2]